MILGRRVSRHEVSCEIPHVRNMDDSFKSSVKVLRVDGIEFSMHAPFLELNLGSYFQEDRASSMGKLKSEAALKRLKEISPE